MRPNGRIFKLRPSPLHELVTSLLGGSYVKFLQVTSNNYFNFLYSGNLFYLFHYGVNRTKILSKISEKRTEACIHGADMR